MYLCTNCQYASVTKLWKCPDCGAFWTFVPDIHHDTGKGKKVAHWHNLAQVSLRASWPTDAWHPILDELSMSTTAQSAVFYAFQDQAYHRVFSSWYKQGGIYLLGGEPWIGKSTLVLQLMQQLELPSVVYFSWEEQANEIIRRQQRVCQKTLDNLTIYHTTSLEDMIATLDAQKVSCVIIDSIQTISSSENDSLAGSPNQVKYCADALVSYCRTHNISLLCLWHVTKWGEIAGPKYLEHIVDVVLYLEGDRYGQYRMLRCSKNRFGGTDDAIVFRMTEHGLVVVWSDFRVREDDTPHSWRVLTVWLENGRPILVHVEALLTKNYTNHPQRTALGIDPKRLQLIIAILEKYCGCRLFQFDIFVNIPWEFTFYDSGVDVAIAAAIYSQYKNTLPTPWAVYIWEIGLSGQVAKSKLHEKRNGIITQPLICLDTVGKNIKDILG